MTNSWTPDGQPALGQPQEELVVFLYMVGQEREGNVMSDKPRAHTRPQPQKEVARPLMARNCLELMSMTPPINVG